MFTAAMSTIAKLRKGPRCPSTDGWIKKMWFINTMEYYSAIRKDEYISFASILLKYLPHSSPAPGLRADHGKTWELVPSALSPATVRAQGSH